MKKQKKLKKESWTESVSRYRRSSSKPARANYPMPKEGIVMHIEELKEKLREIQSKLGFDPSLLPEIIHT
ncbi:hypothetical protein WBJ53_08815 [Spirosoma sp. SC4-14]|uniref:hypothetical protein n=1 Tax=Spirosoma sp. SC4-14 TaxID=3128900 RepID=UPI0030CC7E93